MDGLCGVNVHINQACTSAQHLPNPAVFKKKLSRHFIFQLCQPMRNHDTEQLQEGNGKINSEKMSGQLSSIQLVYPLYTSMMRIDKHIKIYKSL